MSGTMSPIERAREEADRLRKLSAGEVPADPGVQQDPPEGTKPPEVTDPPANQGDPPAAATGDDPNSESYKQRWLSLQGMLKSQQKQIEQLVEQNNALVMELRKARETAPNPLPANATQEQLGDHLNGLIEEYGEQFVGVLQKAIRGEVQGMLNQTLQPVQDRVDAVALDTEEIRRQKFDVDLEAVINAANVKDWKGIWRRPEFQAWLDTSVEKLSGLTYRQMFVDANENWETERIATFFINFAQETGLVIPPTPEPDPRLGLVSPGRSGGQQPQGDAAKKLWTRAEVDQFYRAVQRGDYYGREAEMNLIKQDIYAANSEGRIRG